jgi:hypothetical protein
MEGSSSWNRRTMAGGFPYLNVSHHNPIIISLRSHYLPSCTYIPYNSHRVSTFFALCAWLGLLWPGVSALSPGARAPAAPGKERLQAWLQAIPTKIEALVKSYFNSGKFLYTMPQNVMVFFRTKTWKNHKKGTSIHGEISWGYFMGYEIGFT